MGELWPLVGREAELARITGLIRRGRGALVISGSSGVGRSRLGAEALAIAEAHGMAPARIAGTRAMSRLPLGVFAPLLPADAFNTSPRADGRPELLRRCQEMLATLAGGRRLAVLVDDAHLLDDISIGLLHQLVDAPSVFVIATFDADEMATEEMVGLWKHDEAERIDVVGLDTASIGDLLAAVLGGDVDPALVRELSVAAGGSLVFLRELALAAVEQRALRWDMGVWCLAGPFLPSNRMAELVEARLAGLSDAERAVLELIAFGEPLTPGELPTVELGTIADLERRSIVTSRADGDRTELRLAHAVYGQVLRDRLPALRAREVARTLADAVEATGMRRRDDLLRVASWRLDGGGSRPDQMLGAARLALSRYDFDLAERLARRAMQLGGGFDASFLSAELAAEQGRREEAETEMAALAAQASSDRERGMVAAARLDNVVFAMGNVHLGLHLAVEAEASIIDPSWRAEIAAKRSSVLGGLFGPRACADVAVPVVETADGRARAWAAITGSWAVSRLGKHAQARAIVQRGRDAHDRLETPLEWHRWRLEFFDAEALAHLGDLDESERLALAMYREGLESGSVEEQAWFAWQLSKFVTDRGFPRTGARYGRLAVALFRQLGSRQFESFALGHLATAFAVAGLRRESSETLGSIDMMGLPDTNYYAVDMLQSRAWVATVRGDLPAAASYLHTAAKLGDDIGDLVGATSSLHLLARFGSFEGVLPQLEQHATEIEGPLVQARLAHVRALVAKDGERLEWASAAFSALGATLLAAEAWADASACWRDRGERRRATAATRAAGELVVECESPVTPSLSAIRVIARLTPAERTAALLAANGRKNREIAEELVVSVRTVENHLQHVYEKLGIRGRRELRAAVEVNGLRD